MSITVAARGRPEAEEKRIASGASTTRTGSRGAAASDAVAAAPRGARAAVAGGGAADERGEKGAGIIQNSFLRHALASVLARTATQCILHPLDTIKTRLQVENPSKKIRKYFKRARKNPISISVNGRRIKLMNNYFGRDWKSVKDVYRGFPVMALGTIPWALVHSVVAEYSGEMIQRNAWLKDKNAEVQFALKYVPALICCSFARVPADVIRHKVQIRQEGCKNSIQCIRKISNVEVLGRPRISGFYAGFGFSMARDLVEQFLLFRLYDAARINLARRKKAESERRRRMAAGDTRGAMMTADKNFENEDLPPLPSWAHCSIGFVGGASCALFVAPFDTVKTKLQCGTSASIVQALRQHGFKYLFQGTLPRVMQQACTGCIYFGLYEAAKYLLKPEREEGDRDVWYKIFLKERGKIEKVISVPVS